ncbi:MAG: hypothetical protein M0036_02725 [Desulfobacteraceae bacterium]|nr:hypothetical protein [Desulfobacteraceae bacterium]
MSENHPITEKTICSRCGQPMGNTCDQASVPTSNGCQCLDRPPQASFDPDTIANFDLYEMCRFYR